MKVSEELKKHLDYGSCPSCVYGNRKSSDHPCHECESARPTFTHWVLSVQWAMKTERSMEKTEEKKPEEKEKPVEKRNYKPTSEQAVALQNALEHFNVELFDGALDTGELMVVFTRNPHIIGGYFSPEKWEDDDGNPIHEIAINSNIMLHADPVKLFGILVHELSHYRQWKFGKPTRNGYHNQEWCEFAEEIGLECYDAQGNRTKSSQNVETRITKDGLTEAAIAELPEEALLPFTARPEPDAPTPSGGGSGGGSGKAPKAGRRSKYTCPYCGINMWAKTGIKVLCMMPECDGNQVLIEAA